jgi:hypothetical protein
VNRGKLANLRAEMHYRATACLRSGPATQATRSTRLEMRAGGRDGMDEDGSIDEMTEIEAARTDRYPTIDRPQGSSR